MLLLVIHTFYAIRGYDGKQNGSIATEISKLQDGEEDEHGDAQDDIFYDGDMSYEVILRDTIHEHVLLLE